MNPERRFQTSKSSANWKGSWAQNLEVKSNDHPLLSVTLLSIKESIWRVLELKTVCVSAHEFVQFKIIKMFETVGKPIASQLSHVFPTLMLLILSLSDGHDTVYISLFTVYCFFSFFFP